MGIEWNRNANKTQENKIIEINNKILNERLFGRVFFTEAFFSNLRFVFAGKEGTEQMTRL